MFEKVVEHTDREIKQCPGCNKITKAIFPSDLYGPMQYGEVLKAYTIHLMVAQMISLNRTKKMITALIGETLSESTWLNFILTLHHALIPLEEKTKAMLLTTPCMNVDETSLRVDNKNHWIHVYSSGELTLKCLHRKRGIEAMEAIDVIPQYEGVLVHDCWSSYLSYE